MLRSGGAFLLGLLLAGDFFGKDLGDFFLVVVLGGYFADFYIALVVV